MERIESVEIKHVKGIESKKFDLNLIPNKPSLLVAPNGFGKTSFAIAFRSLAPGGIKLDKDSFYCNNENKHPEISIAYIDANKTTIIRKADKDHNEIKNDFDTFVINSRLMPKARTFKVSGAPVTSASLEVAPIALIEKIPEKAILAYSFTDAKGRFGDSGKVVPNLSAVLSNCGIICSLEDIADFQKLKGAKTAKKIEDFVSGVARLSGTKQQILKEAKETMLAALEEIEQLSKIVATLKNAGVAYPDECEYYIAAIQIAEAATADKALWQKVTKYNRYIKEKRYYEENFKAFNTTWKGIKPKEEGSKGLIVSFPKANQISNGERDVISFLAMLMQAKTKLKKDKCLLIIDEVFDYLDDANLIAAQYYLSSLIQEFKAAGKKIFPLIMTHLNPSYFNTFCFKDQKVYYLSKTAAPNRTIEKILLNREHSSLEETFSRHFLHFHPDPKDLTDEFLKLGLEEHYGPSPNFHTHIYGELTKYLENNTYEPLSVCCAIRVKIEETLYFKLNEEDREAFLDTHTTTKKLDFAESKGLDVPELYYMLGIIYNDGLHLRKHADIITPIASKLNNLTVRGLVKKL